MTETDRAEEEIVVHVLPINDLRVHEESRQCWCRPTENEPGIIVHNSLDGREHFETGERKPS